MTAHAGRHAAMILAACSALALAALGVRAVQLHAELDTANGRLSQLHRGAAALTLDRLLLPQARPVTVCNDTGSKLEIPVLTAVFPGTAGSFVTYNSASDNWRSWTIAAGSVGRFADPARGQAAGWNGSAIFYAMDVESGGAHRLLSGTSGELASGCIHVTAETLRQGN